LFGVNEILEGRGEKIAQDVKNAQKDYKIGSPEYAKALNDVFSSTQTPIDNEIETEKSLEGKNWKQITLENKFYKGNSEQGKQAFNRISGAVSNYNDFHFFPQEVDQQISADGGRVLGEKIKQNLHE
jgi:hypothetical protein